MDTVQKIHWNEIKHIVKNINLEFFNLLEEISNTHELPFYLAKYKYGSLIGKKRDVYLPDNSGDLYILGKKNLSCELSRALEYGSKSLPLGMILNNYCEWFYHQDSTGNSFPFAIQGKGTIFNQQIIFNEEQSVENNTISVSAGAKSVFMLPYIGCQVQHERIKNKYGIKLLAPKSWIEHYEIFKEIISNSHIKNNWSADILFFSKDWVDLIREDPKWIKVKLWFSENLRKRYVLNIHNSFYNKLFIMNESVNKYRPTPFLIDNAKFIFNIILGKGIGFKPSVNNDFLPLKLIQEAYAEYYQLAYTPTIMVPGNLECVGNNNAIYYSLQQPSSMINTFKITMNNSTYKELVVLKEIIHSYLKSFLSKDSDCYGSHLYNACKNIKIDFFHNKPTNIQDNILHSSSIIESDDRFNFLYENRQVTSSLDAKFFRGCIKITKT